MAITLWPPKLLRLGVCSVKRKFYIFLFTFVRYKLFIKKKVPRQKQKLFKAFRETVAYLRCRMQRSSVKLKCFKWSRMISSHRGRLTDATGCAAERRERRTHRDTVCEQRDLFHDYVAQCKYLWNLGGKGWRGGERRKMQSLLSVTNLCNYWRRSSKRLTRRIYINMYRKNYII